MLFDYEKNRANTRILPSENAFLPIEAVIPMLQHQGTQARCLVSVGESVTEGQIIGRQDGVKSVNVHSSIPGIVKGIRRVYNERSEYTDSVIVALSGKFDRLGKRKEYFPWKTLSWSELLHILQEMGVVTMDSHTYPLGHELLSIRKQGCKAIIVNALESEPYLANIPKILLSYPDLIVEGCEIIGKILGIKKIIFAHGNIDSDAVNIIKKMVEKKDIEFEFKPIPFLYPADSPNDLHAMVSNPRFIGFPFKRKQGTKKIQGYPVIGIETILSVAESIVFNKPLIERFVTVSGSSIKESKVLKVRIGMKVGDVIAECGGLEGVPERLVVGGTLRGWAISDLDMPVTKSTRAIIGLVSEEINSGGKSSCIRCTRCTRICPAQLEPFRLFKLLEHDYKGQAISEGLSDCTECGACSYICPSRLPLKQFFSLAVSDRRIAL